MRSMTGLARAAILVALVALAAPAMAHEGVTEVDWKPHGYYAPPPRYYAPPPPAYYDAPPPPRPRHYAPPPVYYYAPPPPRYHRPPPPPGAGLYFRF